MHSFALTEAWGPHGDLALSGSTLYGMTYGGVTNHGKIGSVGSGAVFQINTTGNDYQVLHTFEFPIVADDGSLPFGTPIVLGSELYGMTSLGGSSGLPLGSTDGGCIFSLTIVPSYATQAPTITTTGPLPNGELDVAYSQQLAASGGETPYTWALTAGQFGLCPSRRLPVSQSPLSPCRSNLERSCSWTWRGTTSAYSPRPMARAKTQIPARSGSLSRCRRFLPFIPAVCLQWERETVNAWL